MSDFIMSKMRQNAMAVGAVVTACLALSACTVVSVDEDRMAREQRSDNFSAEAYAQHIWAPKVLPVFGASAPPISEILAASDSNLAVAGAKFGRQSGDGSPWTFATQGEGVVESLDLASRTGRVVISITSPAGPRPVAILAGPVVTGSAIRDSQPYIAFNDFTNQIAYAKVSKEMNRRALSSVVPVLTHLKVGDRIRFAGAFALNKAGDPVRITPVTVQVIR